MKRLSIDTSIFTNLLMVTTTRLSLGDRILSDLSNPRGTLGSAVKMLLSMPKSHLQMPEFKIPLHFQSSFSAVYCQEQQMMTQVLAFLPFTWDTWIKFLALSIVSGPTIWEIHQQTEYCICAYCNILRYFLNTCTMIF